MTKLICKDTLNFFLFDVFKAEELLILDRFQDYDKTSIELFFQSISDIADNELYPIYRKMDKEKAYYKEGRVYVLPELGKAIKAVANSGIIGAMDSFENGGIQLPYCVTNTALSILYAANPNATPYATLTQGAANLISAFGSQELKDIYLEKMYSWEWQGTMALTEPEAGSTLAHITTEAIPQDDGTYKIKGQKIYISAGDHDQTDNIVHLLLARIKGAPKGIKGISLFVVPKYLPQDQELVDNDVITSGIYGKMGQKGYTAAHLMFGEHDNCQGYLVGEPNRGLSYMFQMMNEARIGTGTLSMATASAAYYTSLQYAKERIQGSHPDKKDEQVAIIEHADVRRMLLSQKAYIEGSIGLITYCSILKDASEFGAKEERKHKHLLLELLTPVVKSYCAEQGFQSVNFAMQVLGGAGYTDDFPIEQYLRDTRVNSIYEGTTTIHGMDLLGRKILLEDGLALKLFQKEIEETIKNALAKAQLVNFCQELIKQVKGFEQVLHNYFRILKEKGPRHFLADATLVLELFGLIVIGWIWIKALNNLLEHQDKHSEKFVQSKLATASYFFEYELIKCSGLIQKLSKKEQALTSSISSSIFD
jgi:alkylation response protein AidB-like acyl-CoA dehydrogenase